MVAHVLQDRLVEVAAIKREDTAVKTVQGKANPPRERGPINQKTTRWTSPPLVLVEHIFHVQGGAITATAQQNGFQGCEGAPTSSKGERKSFPKDHRGERTTARAENKWHGDDSALDSHSEDTRRFLSGNKGAIHAPPHRQGVPQVHVEVGLVVQRQLGVVSLGHRLSDLVRGALLVIFRRHEQYRCLDLQRAKEGRGTSTTRDERSVDQTNGRVRARSSAHRGPWPPLACSSFSQSPWIGKQTGGRRSENLQEPAAHSWAKSPFLPLREL